MMDNESEELAKYSKNIRAKVGVHDLLGPGPILTSIELKVLDYLFEEAPSPALNDTYMNLSLCVHQYASLSREYLLTAGPNVFMDGTVIDVVCVMVTEMQRKKNGVLRSWHLPTWVQQRIEKGDDFGDIWKSLSFYVDGSLSGCEKIFIPINEDNKHWYLVVVSALHKATFYVDTCKDNFHRRWNMCLRMAGFVDYLVQSKMIDKDSATRNLGNWGSCDGWYVVEVSNLPDQSRLNDGVNCGAYVTHFMLLPDELPNAAPRTVITAKNRMRLMASLILWEENSERQAILDYLKIRRIL